MGYVIFINNMNFFLKTGNTDEIFGSVLYTTIKEGTLCKIKSHTISSEFGIYNVLEINNNNLIFHCNVPLCYTKNVDIPENLKPLNYDWQDLVINGKYYKKNEPEDGTIIFAELRNGNKKEYAVLNKVKEDDVTFRTYDDNSEVSYSWSVYRYIILEEIK